MASGCHRGGLDLVLGKISSWKELDQAAQGINGVTVPGSVQKPCRCST